MSSKEEIAILVGHVVSFDDHIEKLAAAKSNPARIAALLAIQANADVISKFVDAAINEPNEPRIVAANY
jgi:hypothetical protein